MAFEIGNYDFENLVDEGKLLVAQELERQLRAYSGEVCLCNECVLDMAAMALNSLSPRYRCSLLGSIYQADGLSDPVYAQQLKHAVNVAIRRVAGNPGHD